MTNEEIEHHRIIENADQSSFYAVVSPRGFINEQDFYVFEMEKDRNAFVEKFETDGSDYCQKSDFAAIDEYMNGERDSEEESVEYFEDRLRSIRADLKVGPYSY